MSDVLLSVLIAALAGGVVFMLLERWQREPTTTAPKAAEPEPTAPFWTPYADPAPAPPRPAPWTPPFPEERTEPLPQSRPLWTPPSAGRWDEDDRDRDRRDDDEDTPPGLWSGWARR